MFKERFLQNLDPSYRNTRMADILGYIGSSMEVELIQEAKAMVEKNIDVTRMGVEEFRKYLSFSYLGIRNFNRARGSLHIFDISTTTPTSVLAGSSLETREGKRYFLSNDIIMQNGIPIDVTIEQGQRSSISGTYVGWIQEKIVNIDLDTIVLSLNGVSIPSISQNRPYDGFFACYFDGVLYIKVFSGPTINGLITNIDGASYLVSYITCDGVLGNIGTNSVLNFTDEILDGNGKKIIYSCSNSAIVNGVSEPPLYEIRDLYTYWFFSKNVITKISDYRYWFLSQAIVGDGQIVGDMEMWLELGGTKHVTGKIYTCLVSKTLENLSEGDINVLDLAISSLKDISMIYYFPFKNSKMFFDVTFVSSRDNVSFISWIESAIRNLFDLTYVRNSGGSMFDSFDLNQSLQDQKISDWDVTGLNIIPYYYFASYEAGDISKPGFSGGETNVSFTDVYRIGAVKQGYTTYLFNHWNNITDKVVTDTKSYIEIRDSALAHPQRYGIYENNGGTYTRIGWNNYDTGVIQFDNKTWAVGFLEIKSEIENRAIIKPKDVVIDGEDLTFYIRSFQGMTVLKVLR